MNHRVVVTGMGAVTPLGCDSRTHWEALVSGRSGVAELSQFDASDLPVRIGAEVREFAPKRWLDARTIRRTDRFAQFALAASTMALADAGLDPARLEHPERVAVIWGTGIGGIQTLCEQQEVYLARGAARVSPFFVPMLIGNMAAGQIAMRFGLRGPNTTVATACASSSSAVAEAFRCLRLGEADMAVVGGSEAPFVPLAIAGFASMRALSTRNDEPTRASRPFDADRDGFVLGEGGGALVLEREDLARRRGADPYCEVMGVGMTGDAYHVSAPAPGGEGGARAMRLALQDAGLVPTAIDYVNAHATSTPAGDTRETQALKSVFGDHAYRLAVSANKSMTGHLMGAAGAVELIATVLAVHHRVVPPTINLETPDPECDLDYVSAGARELPCRYALSNSFGFGGQNTTIIVGRLGREPG